MSKMGNKRASQKSSSYHLFLCIDGFFYKSLTKLLSFLAPLSQEEKIDSFQLMANSMLEILKKDQINMEAYHFGRILSLTMLMLEFEGSPKAIDVLISIFSNPLLANKP